MPSRRNKTSSDLGPTTNRGGYHYFGRSGEYYFGNDSVVRRPGSARRAACGGTAPRCRSTAASCRKGRSVSPQWLASEPLRSALRPLASTPDGCTCLDRCRGPHGGRCPGRRGVGAPAVDCARYQGDESRRGGGDCHEPRAAGCRVVAGAGVGGDTLCICGNDAGFGGPVWLRSTRSVHGSAHAASRSIFLRRSRSASREATAVPATLVSRARSSRGISCWSANTMTDSNVRP